MADTRPILSLSKLLETKDLEGLKSTWEVKNPNATLLIKKKIQIADKKLLDKGLHTIILGHHPTHLIINTKISGACNLWYSNSFDDRTATLRIKLDNKSFDIKTACKRPIIPIPVVNHKKQMWFLHYVLPKKTTNLQITMNYLSLPETRINDLCDRYDLSFVDYDGSLFLCSDREIVAVTQ